MRDSGIVHFLIQCWQIFLQDLFHFHRTVRYQRFELGYFFGLPSAANWTITGVVPARARALNAVTTPLDEFLRETRGELVATNSPRR